MLRLIFSNLRRRLARTLLTVAAIALSVSLVVSTTSGYASAEAAVRGFINNYLGTDDAKVSAGDDAEGIPETVLEEIRDDPAVHKAFGRLEISRQLRDAEGEFVQGNFSVLGVDPAVDAYLSRLPLDSGDKPTDQDQKVALVDFGARDELGVGIGDTIEMPGPDGATSLEVIGIVYKPTIITALGIRTVYVPLQTLQETVRPDDPDRITSIAIEYEVGIDGEAFVEKWNRRFAQMGVGWEMRQVREDREAVDRGLRGMNLLSLMGGMVSLLAATFIVFGTLSMGVAERQRTLAMLRAVGATRGQIAFTVIGEGLALAAIGVAIGVPLGLAFIWGLTQWYSGVFSAGMAIGWIGILVAVVGMTLAATLAAALPAWTASRVDPLAAMRPSAEHVRTSPPWQWALAGLLLISIDSLLLWPPIGVTPLSEFWEKTARFWLHFVLGLPMLMLGFFLLAPMLIWLAERLVATPLAWIARVEPALLRQQLSGGLWRAAGTAAALMVGLAVLIVMNTQGRSGIDGWRLPDKFPDVFLFNRTGISKSGIETIAQADGIKRLPNGQADISPIGYLHPRLGESYFAIGGSAFLPDKTMFVAVDPRRIFDMMALDFTAGNAATAKRMLLRGTRATLNDGTVVDGSFEQTDTGRAFVTLPTEDEPAEWIDASRVVETTERHYLLVTEEFRQLQGLGPGENFTLRKPGEGVIGRIRGEPVEFTIVGVVRSPGIDLMVATFDLAREFRSESAASVFGSIEDARELFGMENVFLVAANLELGVEKEKLVQRLSEQLGDQGISVGDVRQLKYEIQQGLRNLLTVASVVAWAAMAVASLGVANTVMAGVRSRQYQLGVLRAVGVTRGELLRLILAEALLLGIAASTLGVAAGLTMTLNARQLSEWTIGYVPPLRIAWDVLWTGVAAVMAVSLLAAAWPAWSTARRQVLRLLQSGRAAA